MIQESVEYGKREIKDVEVGLNEVVKNPYNINEDINQKIKIKKTPGKFSKEEYMKESIV